MALVPAVVFGQLMINHGLGQDIWMLTAEEITNVLFVSSSNVCKRSLMHKVFLYRAISLLCASHIHQAVDLAPLPANIHRTIVSMAVLRSTWNCGVDGVEWRDCTSCSMPAIELHVEWMERDNASQVHQCQCGNICLRGDQYGPGCDHLFATDITGKMIRSLQFSLILMKYRSCTYKWACERRRALP